MGKRIINAHNRRTRKGIIRVKTYERIDRRAREISGMDASEKEELAERLLYLKYEQKAVDTHKAELVSKFAYEHLTNCQTALAGQGALTTKEGRADYFEELDASVPPEHGGKEKSQAFKDGGYAAFEALGNAQRALSVVVGASSVPTFQINKIDLPDKFEYDPFQVSVAHSDNLPIRLDDCSPSFRGGLLKGFELLAQRVDRKQPIVGWNAHEIGSPPLDKEAEAAHFAKIDDQAWELQTTYADVPMSLYGTGDSDLETFYQDLTDEIYTLAGDAAMTALNNGSQNYVEGQLFRLRAAGDHSHTNLRETPIRTS